MNTMGKRKCYKIHEKLELVNRVRSGISQAKVCRETGINESTLRGWLREEDKLRSFVLTVSDTEGLAMKSESEFF